VKYHPGTKKEETEKVYYIMQFAMLHVAFETVRNCQHKKEQKEL
jgi:hypothetical protein